MVILIFFTTNPMYIGFVLKSPRQKNIFEMYFLTSDRNKTERQWYLFGGLVDFIDESNVRSEVTSDLF